ncbi:MAG: DNA primase [Candidatus Aenigmarchaeota archaeon]|nr:DNA primase [Candidatus Aenigmarchaeota archaeon]
MGKLAQSSSKYTIIAKFHATGTVEKPDVIGAIFGQTEGLLGPDMDLRELQRTGRVGRIDVIINTENGKSNGEIIIPSSLDASETALLAACTETIERVGPCNAKIKVDKIEDVRITKRQYVINRAKELLAKMMEQDMPDTQQLSDELKKEVRAAEVTEYNGLVAGPSIADSDSIIVVEGRADVVKLLKAGIKNVIANGGTSVSKQMIDLCKTKIVTVFLDGDRGGDLILKELLSVTDVDFVARAPKGKEVEDLSIKEIFKALREKVPVDQAKFEYKTGEEAGSTRKYNSRSIKQINSKKSNKYIIDPEKKEIFKKYLDDLIGTRAAFFLTSDFEPLGKVPIKEMGNMIKESKPNIVIFDGTIDQNLIKICYKSGVQWIVGKDVKGRIKRPEGLHTVVMKDLEE